MRELIIEKPELQIFLNLIQKRGITVSYPLYNMDLLKAEVYDDGYRIKVLASEKNFRDFLKDRKEFLEELPTYRDFRECFLASGIIRYDNVDEFLERLELYKGLTKGVVFAPDTNVLYHSFISNFKPLKGYEIIIVDLVKKEIENSMNFKYRPADIKALRRVLYHGELLNEFYNKRKMKSRKAAYIALKEFDKLKDRAIEVESVKEEARTNDELIVKTLKKFDQENAPLTILLTADIAMTDIAKLEGVEHFLFEYPHGELDELFAAPHQLRALLFNLAAVFGVIQINRAYLFGEFRGKAKLNELKMLLRGEYEEMKFHLEICRKIMGLKIKK
ncbi:hypothetical protein PAP_05725 [Palaeococcus pacificus DY20341]|uniref:PIN domain-containing protein n=1 Tax=Palaeococcus pacificus DY20341 TaxID=1343739 RepID=A0A075LS04_9EURY|nr:PIN domain-containing protein [Palaeococcus pacificus]AIF69545.1 hypothetical protein PAP_05725 [Palaeococcus pacificus DY20341]